jgi:poly(3-hydroxybutyrate) depolymerase
MTFDTTDSCSPGALARRLLAGASLVAGLLAAAGAPAAGPPPLPALGLAADGVTVSGLSSGGYMAGQFHVAYAASLAGAAVLAGGPYGCSRGAVSTAVYQCSCPAEPGELQRWLQRVPAFGCGVMGPGVLASFADDALRANRAHIDAPAELARQRVWLLSGGEDHVVDPALVEAAAAFYRRHGVPEAQVHHERLAGAGHGMPVPGGPVACGRTATPFLTDCPGLGAAHDLLAWLYGVPLQPALPVRAAGLRRFSQLPYRVPGRFDGLDTSGWLYLPAACEVAGAGCRLHVAFHGCKQGQGYAEPGGQHFGTRFVQGAGYNGWAEANRIVVLYPQVTASPGVGGTDPYQLNPQGCWDFWGYTLPGDALTTGVQRRFAWRDAPQMQAVKAMVDALLRQP